jgi:hypothetical protein
VHRYSQLRRRDLQHCCPAAEAHFFSDGDVRDDQPTGLEREIVGRVQRGTRPGRWHGLGRQRCVQLVERLVPPRVQIRYRHMLGDREGSHGADRPVLNRDGSGRSLQQRSQRGYDGLRLYKV